MQQWLPHLAAVIIYYHAGDVTARHLQIYEQRLQPAPVERGEVSRTSEFQYRTSCLCCFVASMYAALHGLPSSQTRSRKVVLTLGIRVPYLLFSFLLIFVSTGLTLDECTLTLTCNELCESQIEVDIYSTRFTLKVRLAGHCLSQIFR